jgi:predicted transposase/invertase (TIGR01784 family)
VLLTDFTLLNDALDYHTHFLLRSKDGRIVLTHALEFHILELSKVPVEEDDRKVWPWLKFLASVTKEEFAMLQQTHPELQKPVARLMELSADEIVRRQKDAWDKARWDEASRISSAKAEGEAKGRAEGKAEGKAEGRVEGRAEGRAEGKAEGKAEGRAEGKAEGRAEGKAEGRAEGRAEIAANMRQKGIPISMIAELTGLTIAEIEALPTE